MTDKHTDEVTGRIKEAAGVLTDNQELKDEGRLEQTKSSVKHAVETAVDKVADVLSGHRGNGARKS
jgi:uncharacterized protein YjbJ (UPF0337 family)